MFKLFYVINYNMIQIIKYFKFLILINLKFIQFGKGKVRVVSYGYSFGFLIA